MSSACPDKEGTPDILHRTEVRIGSIQITLQNSNWLWTFSGKLQNTQPQMVQGANASDVQGDGVQILFLQCYFDLFSRNPGEGNVEYSEGFHYGSSSYHGEMLPEEIQSYSVG